MVPLALRRLEEGDVVELDEERKAAMVSNPATPTAGNIQAVLAPDGCGRAGRGLVSTNISAAPPAPMACVRLRPVWAPPGRHRVGSPRAASASPTPPRASPAPGHRRTA